MFQSAACLLIHLPTNLLSDGEIGISHIFITTSCVVIFSNGWLIKTPSKNTGKHPGADSTSKAKDFFNTRLSAVTTLHLMQSAMKHLHQRKNGQQNKNGEKFLEHHSLTNDSPESRQILEGQLRECFGRVVYSHKTHEKCADILLSRLSTIKLWQIILSAITTGGFIAAIFGAGEVGAALGIVISTSLLVLNAYSKNYDLGELAQKHKQAANDLWLIRERYLSLIIDLKMGEKPIEVLQQIRDELTYELHTAYSGVPSTTVQAYRKAQDALKKYEDMTFSDTEIDAFLPKDLKRG